MNKFLEKSTSGFTLVETLVAVSILVIGVIGPLSLAARGISDGLFAQNQLTANLLAQEAMESIVSLRNTNILNNPTVPFAGIWEGVDSQTVGINPVSGALSFDCTHGNGDPGCYLNNRDAEGNNKTFYEKSERGPFLRQISISKLSEYELKVVVTVSWKNKTVDKHFTISEYLYAK